MIKILSATTLFAAFLMGSLVHAQTRFASRGFENYANPALVWSFPRNNLHLQDRMGLAGGITEEQFNQITDAVLKVWEPIAAAKGVTLVNNKDWKDSTVNASAEQSGKRWIVNMYGGLARRPEVTPDGYALVVCHELGHHFGGYAFYDNSSWASSEGQSDYFATNVCAKAIWGKDVNNNLRFRSLRGIPTSVQTSCATAWPNNANAQGWCARTVAGGQSLANLLASLGGSKMPNVDTPDTTVVKRTQTGHPAAQCRLDTYFAGALCGKPWDMNVIPGRGNPKGQQSKEAEMEAMKTSCFAKEGFKAGYRPACWFKAVIE